MHARVVLIVHGAGLLQLADLREVPKQAAQGVLDGPWGPALLQHCNGVQHGLVNSIGLSHLGHPTCLETVQVDVCAPPWLRLCPQGWWARRVRDLPRSGGCPAWDPEPGGHDARLSAEGAQGVSALIRGQVEVQNLGLGRVPAPRMVNPNCFKM